MLPQRELAKAEFMRALYTWTGDCECKRYYRENYHLMTIFEVTLMTTKALCNVLFNPTKSESVSKDLESIILDVVKDRRAGIIGYMKNPNLPLMPICWIEANAINSKLKLTVFTVDENTTPEVEDFVRYEVGILSKVDL